MLQAAILSKWKVVLKTKREEGKCYERHLWILTKKSMHKRSHTRNFTLVSQNHISCSSVLKLLITLLFIAFTKWEETPQRKED